MIASAKNRVGSEIITRKKGGSPWGAEGLFKNESERNGISRALSSEKANHDSGTRGIPYIKPESSDMTDHFRPLASADSRSRKWMDRPATMFPSRGATAARPRIAIITNEFTFRKNVKRQRETCPFL